MNEKLGNIATYLNGYAFKPSDWSEDGLPIIRIQDLTGTSTDPHYYNQKYDEKYEINDGDVLISWSASLGVYVWHGEKALLNQHIFKVIFDKIEIDKDFFVYQVEYILEKAGSLAHGATMRHLTRPIFNNLNFTLFPIDEQKQIAQTLNIISNLILKKREQINCFDELVKSRFVEMFGDPAENPHNYPVKKFTEFAMIDAKLTTDYEKYANYPHIGIDSIEKDTGFLSGYRTVGEDNIKSAKYIFTPNHIIYSKIRPNLNKVALPDFNGLCSADAYPILPNPKKCSRIYLAYVMKSQKFLHYIIPLSGRVNMPKVNREQINRFKWPLPPIFLQDKFADFVHRIDKSRMAVQKSLDELEILKKSLLQEYFG